MDDKKPRLEEVDKEGTLSESVNDFGKLRPARDKKNTIPVKEEKPADKKK